MSHNLNYNKEAGRHSFFSRKEKAWHNLGLVVENALTSEDAIKTALLNYTVEKAPLFAQINNDLSLEEARNNNSVIKVNGYYRQASKVPNQFATYRTDTNEVFGIVGKGYEVVQNVDAFAFFDNIVGSKEAIFETAGALGLGERIFITAKLPNNIRMLDRVDDEIEQYLLFTSAHDGSGVVECLFTPIRVVCNNTLSMALGRAINKVRIKHTKSAQDKLKDGLNLMHLYRTYMSEFSDTIKHLASIPIKDKDIELLVSKLFLTNNEILLVEQSKSNSVFGVDEISTVKKNNISTVVATIESGVGQDVYRGTKLWVYNGVTNYLNNVKEYKTSEDKFDVVSGGVLSQKMFNLLMM